MSNNSQILNKIAEYQQLYKNLVKKKKNWKADRKNKNYELNCIKSSLGKVIVVI